MSDEQETGAVIDELVVEAYGTVTPPPDQSSSEDEEKEEEA